MSEHGQFVVLLGQGRAGVPPPLLLQRQVAGSLPVELCRVRVVQGAVVGPGDRAEHRTVVPVQAGDVLDREGAAVGDQQGSRPQQIFGQQPVALLANSGVAVAIAVQALAQDRDGPQFIDHRGEADLDEFGVVPIAVRDVSGGYVGRVRGWPGVVGWAWLGGLISAVEDEVGRIEVQAVRGRVRRGETSGQRPR